MPLFTKEDKRRTVSQLDVSACLAGVSEVARDYTTTASEWVVVERSEMVGPADCGYQPTDPSHYNLTIGGCNKILGIAAISIPHWSGMGVGEGKRSAVSQLDVSGCLEGFSEVTHDYTTTALQVVEKSCEN